MLKTRAPDVRRSLATAASATSSRKLSSAKSTTTTNSAKAIQPTDQSRPGSPIEDKTVHGIASNKEALTTSKGLKRKSTAYENDTPDNTPATKKAKTSPSPEADSTDPAAEILFPTKPNGSPKVASPGGQAPITPPKKIARRKKPAVTILRTDLRMGTSGTTAVGSGTIQTQKPKQSTTVKTPKPVPAVPAPSKPQSTADAKAEKEALKNLKVATAAASASKQASTIVRLRSNEIPGMLRQLVAADKSVAKPRVAAAKVAAWMPKPESRQDNDEIGDLINDAYNRPNVRPSKTAGMSAGAKKLLKMRKETERQAGRYMNPANAYKRQREDEDAHIERVRKAARRE
ncbi:uncharacterized protein N0V89_001965 [Didymosphaeria variabile]|uniref:Uncharacterized protein n=1 Tax=Didymosphaeria variabile TaxID=1932322 RepID=A0A9W8XTK7_9PLEO|nr:uncharacterized protein N0V89_001965 [Didymosphaeria variabile]KAJ4357390.1 hypothetical protein N0V89_001965 [Didymosphaeria variabile]